MKRLALSISLAALLVFALVALLQAAPAPTQARPTLTRVLFIYGSVPPGTDLGDMIRLNNTGRNGYSQLADYLHTSQGHNLEEVSDLDPSVNPLRETHLKLYDLVVLGSNNRQYAAREAGEVLNYVRGGGALLALSDSRFGLSPDRANDVPGAGERSDNDIIAQFGMEIHHDNYTVVVAGGKRFANPNHPILAGVGSFKGEGVSLIRVTNKTAQILVRGNGLPLTNGQITGSDYAITAIAQEGRGRVAATFDRNTFFNAGVGSDGTDLSEHDNRLYAHNLFNWLARPNAPTLDVTR